MEKREQKNQKFIELCQYQSIFDKLKERFKQYTNNSNYCYKIVCYSGRQIPYFVVMQKLDDTITNESRKNVVNPQYAKFRANKLKVIDIINCKDMIDEESVVNVLHLKGFSSKKTAYEVGNIVVPDEFDSNIENICTGGIHYFNSIDAVYHFFVKFLNINEKKHYNSNGACDRDISFPTHCERQIIYRSPDEKVDTYTRIDKRNHEGIFIEHVSSITKLPDTYSIFIKTIDIKTRSTYECNMSRTYHKCSSENSFSTSKRPKKSHVHIWISSDKLFDQRTYEYGDGSKTTILVVFQNPGDELLEKLTCMTDNDKCQKNCNHAEIPYTKECGITAGLLELAFEYDINEYSPDRVHIKSSSMKKINL